MAKYSPAPTNEDSILGEEYQPDLDDGVKKALKKSDEQKYESLEQQCINEIAIAWDHQNGKKAEALLRLKLYNNQKRDKSTVGDTTMFTVHQTILASLYTDRLTADWLGREDGDDEVAETLNAMAEFDYDEMEKDQTDFDWIWDTLFFGRGLCNLTEYLRDPEKNIYLPIPEIWDPTTFLRDPRCTSINGNTRTGKNKARFYGRDIRMTRDEMKADPAFFNLDFRSIKYGGSINSMVDAAAEARNDAQGNNSAKMRGEGKLGDNAEYELKEWYTHWKVSGELKKCKVFLANNHTKVVGFKEIGDPDKKWGLIDRPLYPTAHDFDGTSVPDLTEDKQRHRAVAQNLGLKAMTADLYPSYIYDQQKIKNRGDLAFGYNRMTAVDGSTNDAITPLRKAAPNMGLLQFIYETLDRSAQQATATPDIKQGMQSNANRPLGETNLLASQSDTRYSLSAKIFGWSEKRFWLQWYTLYKENFEADVDKKVLRLVGAFGSKWRPLERENIIANVDPDVKIESLNVSRAKMMEDRQIFQGFFSLALQDPTANRRWALKKLGKLNGMKKDELDRLFPPTIDEMQAEDENDLLNKDKFVQVLDGQDDVTHLEIHSKANPTKATMAHIETTKHLMMIKKQKAIAEAQKQQGVPGQTSQPAGMTSPAGSSVPGMASPIEAGPVAPSQTSNAPGPIGG